MPSSLPSHLTYSDGYVPGGYGSAPAPHEVYDIRFHPQGWYYVSRGAAAPPTRPYHGAGPGHWVLRAAGTSKQGWVWLPIGQQSIWWRGHVDVWGSPPSPLGSPWIETTKNYWVNGSQLHDLLMAAAAPNPVHAGLP